MLIVWTLLKAYWKPIAIGLAIFSVLAYIKILHVEVNHYESEAKSYKASYDSLVAAQTKRVAELQATFTAQDKVRAASTAAQASTINAQQKVISQKIHENAELKRTIISAAARELFNESTQNRPDQSTTTPQANTGDASQTTSSHSTTLDVLLDISNQNNANHNTCIKAVEAWQSMWTQYEKDLNGPSNAP